MSETHVSAFGRVTCTVALCKVWFTWPKKNFRAAKLVCGVQCRTTVSYRPLLFRAGALTLELVLLETSILISIWALTNSLGFAGKKSETSRQFGLPLSVGSYFLAAHFTEKMLACIQISTLIQEVSTPALCPIWWVKQALHGADLLVCTSYFSTLDGLRMNSRHVMTTEWGKNNGHYWDLMLCCELFFPQSSVIP